MNRITFPVTGFDPWAPTASHARTSKLAKATPRRQIEVTQPGPVTIIKGPFPASHLKTGTRPCCDGDVRIGDLCRRCGTEARS